VGLGAGSGTLGLSGTVGPREGDRTGSVVMTDTSPRHDMHKPRLALPSRVLDSVGAASAV
jgi:hypothetical protein